MLKIKRILHWLYCALPAILTFIVYGKISKEINISETFTIGRWVFLVIAFAYLIFLGWIALVRLSVCDDFDQAEDDIGLERFSVAESLHYTTIETLVCMVSIFYMDLLRLVMQSWSYIAQLYGYIILIIYGFPFIISIFSIISVKKPAPGYTRFDSDDVINKIIKFLWVSSIVAMFVSVANLALSLLISSMDVCIYSYLILIPTFIFEWIYLRRSIKKIWPKNKITISEEDKKEGIQ